jgi:hypothetical protein
MSANRLRTRSSFWRIGPSAVALVGALIGTVLATESASAQAVGNAPWCVDMGVLGNGYLECQYFTYQQCWARASGISNACVANPWYRPQRTDRRYPRDPRR